jgi:fermentation-respiration switch protein FrsA (DUF1100 family)
MKKIRLIGYGLLFGAIIFVLALYAAGVYFTKPELTFIGVAPKELAAEAISIQNIRGWYHQSETSSSCILLLHGVRANRTSMINRALFLKDLGYSVLLIDFQAHGETPGDQITFGYRESANVKAAINFLKQSKHCTKIAAIGTSLGGAATLLGEQPAQVDALILESVYPTIEQAVYDRLNARIGKFLARIFAPLLYEQLPLRLHIQLDQLHPIDSVKQLRSPVFIISGTADKHTTASETEQLFNTAPEPKLLWLIKGADHEDLHAFAGHSYEQNIQNFLTTYLTAK